MPLALVLVLASLVAAGASPARAEEATLLIVNPSGRGNQSMAGGFLADLSAALQQAGAPPVSGRYHVTEADAIASIKRLPPTLALVSPGFYLAHRDALKLVPILQPVRAHEGPGVVHLIVREGATAPPIASMRLGGQLAGEPAWVVGPVLRLPEDARPEFLPAAKVLEAVRQLQAGQLDGILLSDADWHLLGQTGKSDGLRVGFTSEPLPEGPVVSFGDPNGGALALAAALQRLSESDAGRKVLERMTLRGFRPAMPADFEALAPIYDAARRGADAD